MIYVWSFYFMFFIVCEFLCILPLPRIHRPGHARMLRGLMYVLSSYQFSHRFRVKNYTGKCTGTITTIPRAQGAFVEGGNICWRYGYCTETGARIFATTGAFDLYKLYCVIVNSFSTFVFIYLILVIISHLYQSFLCLKLTCFIRIITRIIPVDLTIKLSLYYYQSALLSGWYFQA